MVAKLFKIILFDSLKIPMEKPRIVVAIIPVIAIIKVFIMPIKKTSKYVDLPTS